MSDTITQDLVETQPSSPEAGCEWQRVDRRPGADSVRHAYNVSDIMLGAVDGAGRRIEAIYSKRPDYAVYGAGGLVVIQYADSLTKADTQAASVDAVADLRGEIEYISRALRPQQRSFYLRQLASGLQATLDQRADMGRQILLQAITSAGRDLVILGRKSYLVSASGVSATFAIPLIFVGGMLRGGAAEAGLLLVSAGGGAIGAILSISIAFQGRHVATTQDGWTNVIDGALRVAIGVIAGFFFPLLLVSGLLGPLSIGSASGLVLTAAKGVTWQTMLAMGFVAGFLERLLPDLLDKRGQQNTAAGHDGTASRP